MEWWLILVIVLAAIAALMLVMTLPDIARYLRMRRM
ncbi:hypothetical protein BH23CHL10_BH23CHL10_09480 [soil metagenome]